MAHSVSHNLFFELNGEHLNVITIKKDGVIDGIQSYPLVDPIIFENILKELPDIFSEITLLVRSKNFVCLPENFYNKDLQSLFSLSYTPLLHEELVLDQSEFGIGICYGLDIEITKLIRQKFSRVIIKHEVTVIIEKLFKEINFKQSRILITIHENHLIVLAIHDGKMVLCNSYLIKTNDDVFYFVMLAIEQLHLLPSETELIILGEPPKREDIFELFKNYIKEINIWIEDFKPENDIKFKELLSHSFALQSLLCE